MNYMLFIMPAFSVYLVIRAVMHKRAGRQRWFIHYLFMASLMIPLFTPEGVNFNKLLRALIGFTMFSAAYVAEVIRGGLQALPKGQFEAADAMGMSYWQKTNLIILPQALKLVIPPIMNTFKKAVIYDSQTQAASTKFIDSGIGIR